MTENVKSKDGGPVERGKNESPFPDVHFKQKHDRVGKVAKKHSEQFHNMSKVQLTIIRLALPGTTLV